MRRAREKPVFFADYDSWNRHRTSTGLLRRTKQWVVLAVPSLLAGGLLLGSSLQAADSQPRVVGGNTENQAPAPSAPLAAYTDWKKSLLERGISLQFNHVSDVGHALTGGVRRGTFAGGLSEFVFDADLAKLAGWAGLSFHANAFWTYGAGLTRSYTQNLLPTANIEALPSLRLSEIWLEHKSDSGKFAVRVGQMAADNEFLISQYSRLFTSGWLASTVFNLPGGGPIYPLSTPGLRVKYDDGETWVALAGVFNGNPAGSGLADRQRLNRHGVNFRIGDSPLLIVELQRRHGGAANAPGTVKLGGWRHFGTFENLHTGQSRTGNFAVYGVVEQQVMKFHQGAVLGAFGRVSASPGNLNLIDAYLDAGLTLSGFLAGRSEDAIGAAFAYGRVSRAARAGASLNGEPQYRSREIAIELTYSAQLAPGLTVQPHVKHIFHGGGVLDSKGQVAKDSTQLGIRTSLGF